MYMYMYTCMYHVSLQIRHLAFLRHVILVSTVDDAFDVTLLIGVDDAFDFTFLVGIDIDFVSNLFFCVLGWRAVQTVGHQKTQRRHALNDDARPEDALG